MAEEALISRARSRAASRFLQADAATAGDVLLMVDHDIQWQPGDLAYLARRALERTAVVGGIYPKRAFRQGTAIRFATDGTADGTWTIGSDTLIPSEYVGSGFLAIPRSALEVLSETLPWIEEGYWPFFLPETVELEVGGKRGWEYLSEDWSFCRRVRAAGYGVFAACSPRLTHTGTYTFRMVDARAEPPPDEAITFFLSRAGVSG